jgi:hypothetical protein
MKTAGNPKIQSLFFYLLSSVFATLFWYTALLIMGQKSGIMGIQERLEGKFFVSYVSAKPFHYSCKGIMPFL